MVSLRIGISNAILTAGLVPWWHPSGFQVVIQYQRHIPLAGEGLSKIELAVYAGTHVRWGETRFGCVKPG
jgi:hypothetical protein